MDKYFVPEGYCYALALAPNNHLALATKKEKTKQTLCIINLEKNKHTEFLIPHITKCPFCQGPNTDRTKHGVCSWNTHDTHCTAVRYNPKRNEIFMGYGGVGYGGTGDVVVIDSNTYEFKTSTEFSNYDINDIKICPTNENIYSVLCIGHELGRIDQNGEHSAINLEYESNTMYPTLLNMDFSPQGTQLIAAHQKFYLRHYDVDTARNIKDWFINDKRYNESNYVHKYDCVCAYINENEMVTCHQDKEKGLQIWDMRSYEAVRKMPFSYIPSNILSITSSKVVIGGKDGTLQLWDVRNGQCLKTISEGHGYISVYPSGVRHLDYQDNRLAWIDNYKYYISDLSLF